jgi:hypothetical protein
VAAMMAAGMPVMMKVLVINIFHSDNQTGLAILQLHIYLSIYLFWRPLY